MVHEVYITKNGKKFGPYYYKSVRIGGKTKKIYVGNDKKTAERLDAELNAGKKINVRKAVRYLERTGTIKPLQERPHRANVSSIKKIGSFYWVLIALAVIGLFSQAQFTGMMVGNDFIVTTDYTDCAVINTEGLHQLTQSISDSSTSTCISITANNVIFDCLGNTIDGDNSSSSFGISVTRSSPTNANITIRNCTLTEWLVSGVRLVNISNSTLNYITANGNSDGNGIYIISGNNITISNPTTNGNNVGIYLLSTQNSTISGQTASSNEYAAFLSSSHNNTITNSIINNNIRGIYPYSSHSSTIRNSNITNNYYGVIIWMSLNNTFSNLIVVGNNHGLLLGSDINGTVIANSTIRGNTLSGIYSNLNQNATIYNNFFNNTNNTDSNETAFSNNWNTTKTAGTNIAGGSYMGGNYWAYPNGTGPSQTCSDLDADYICDANYTVNSNNIDYLPLTNADTTPPQLTIVSPTNITYTTPAINFNISSSEALSFCKYSTNNWQSNTTMTLFSPSYYYNITTVGDGAYTARFWCNDTKGNINSTQNVSFTVNAPPQISFIPPAPQNATTTTNSSVQINISIVEISNLSELKFNWNGTNYTYYDNSSLVLMFNFGNLSALGENSTVAADISARNNNGTPNGNAVYVNSGKYNCAYYFDGSGDYISALHSSSLNLTQQFTLEAWINTSSGGGGSVITKVGGATGTYGYELLIDNVTGRISCGFSNSSSSGGADWKTSSIIGGNVTSNILTYIACTYDANNLSIYQNGTLVNSTAVGTTTINNSLANLRISGDENNNNYFNGTIDEVRIWNRSLSVAEIQQQYYSNLNKFNQTQWYFYTNQSNLTDGMYTYFGSARDGAGNENRTNTREITVDATPPTINLVSPANNAETTSTTATFSFNVSDSSAVSNCSLIIGGSVAVTNTTVTKNTTQWFTRTLSSGSNYSWGVNCTDVANNTGNSTIRNLIISSDSGGSSGGGGGGSGEIGTKKNETTPAQNITNETKTQPLNETNITIEKIEPNKNYTVVVIKTDGEKPLGEFFKVLKDEAPVLEVSIESYEEIKDVTITVRKIDKKPEYAPEPSQTTVKAVNQYFEIETNESKKIKEANISIFVEKEWLVQNSLTKAEVKVLRLYGGVWQELDTKATKQDEKFVYYTATSPGLSLFTIVAKRIQPGVQVCDSFDRKCADNELRECSPYGTQWLKLEDCKYGCEVNRCKEQPSNTTELLGNYLIWAVLIVFVILILFLYVFIKLK